MRGAIPAFKNFTGEKMKTVKHLIEELKKYDSDMPVVTIKNIEYSELCIKKWRN